MARKQISKPQEIIDCGLKSLRDLGYISAACASVLGGMLPDGLLVTGMTEIGGHTMSDDRVERVARALCKVDGNDPNAKVPSGRMVTTGEHGAEFYFAWTDYEKEARRFIAATDAARPV